MSPAAFHFTEVLFVAAVALVPSHTQTSLSPLLGAVAIVGAVYAGFVIRRLLTDNIADLPDRLAYGLAPLVGYAAIFAAAALVYRGSAKAAEVLADAILLLLMWSTSATPGTCCSPWHPGRANCAKAVPGDSRALHCRG
jgi:hypothetical protein